MNILLIIMISVVFYAVVFLFKWSQMYLLFQVNAFDCCFSIAFVFKLERLYFIIYIKLTAKVSN